MEIYSPANCVCPKHVNWSYCLYRITDYLVRLMLQAHTCGLLRRGVEDAQRAGRRDGGLRGGEADGQHAARQPADYRPLRVRRGVLERGGEAGESTSRTDALRFGVTSTFANVLTEHATVAVICTAS